MTKPLEQLELWPEADYLQPIAIFRAVNDSVIDHALFNVAIMGSWPIVIDLKHRNTIHRYRMTTVISLPE